MGVLLFAVILGVVGELLWFKFYRTSQNQFTKYDKEHSTVAILDAAEIVTTLNKHASLGISDIKLEENQVSFTYKKDYHTIHIEDGKAYAEYDMFGFGVRLSFIGKITKKFKFWKCVHKAMHINVIMDTFQNNSLPTQKEYEKTKIFAKASVIAYAAFLIFLVIGFFTAIKSISNSAVSDVQKMEFYNDITYEELIDSYVKDAEWTAFNTDNDVAVVEVSGISIEGENICIQFWGSMGMGFSDESLELAYFEVNGVSINPIKAMESIYMYYYLNE